MRLSNHLPFSRPLTINSVRPWWLKIRPYLWCLFVELVFSGCRYLGMTFRIYVRSCDWDSQLQIKFSDITLQEPLLGGASFPLKWSNSLHVRPPDTTSTSTFPVKVLMCQWGRARGGMAGSSDDQQGSSAFTGPSGMVTAGTAQWRLLSPERLQGCKSYWVIFSVCSSDFNVTLWRSSKAGLVTLGHDFMIFSAVVCGERR